MATVTRNNWLASPSVGHVRTNLLLRRAKRRVSAAADRQWARSHQHPSGLYLRAGRAARPASSGRAAPSPPNRPRGCGGARPHLRATAHILAHPALQATNQRLRALSRTSDVPRVSPTRRLRADLEPARLSGLLVSAPLRCGGSLAVSGPNRRRDRRTWLIGRPRNARRWRALSRPQERSCIIRIAHKRQAHRYGEGLLAQGLLDRADDLQR